VLPLCSLPLRAALEKFGVEQADINFPATGYGYLVPGKHGLLQPKVSQARPGQAGGSSAGQ
jgi:hypothetical protein